MAVAECVLQEVEVDKEMDDLIASLASDGRRRAVHISFGTGDLNHQNHFRMCTVDTTHRRTETVKLVDMPTLS